MQAALKPAGPAVKPAAPTRRVAVAGATGRAPPATAEPRGPKESRIGKAPILVPAGATITLEDAYIKVKGPKGELELNYPPLVEIKKLDNGALRVYKKVESRAANATHGLVRALAANMVHGTTEGFTKTLSMVGVGYRAAMKGNLLVLSLGYSHPVEMPVPKGLAVAVEKSTTLHITGADKQAVGQFAADVRAKRPPEPYKGKGVRYVDEYVRRKEGKRGK